MGGLSKDRTIIDEKNALILNLLQEDCRMSLTKMAQKVGLSVDSVRKRLEKMKKWELFRPKVQVRPRNLGFSNVADIKIKLHNYSPKEMQELVEWTQNVFAEKKYHPLLIVGNFLVEFLQIHPFQDGNGRLSRVLTNLLLLQEGYLYMPYVSHEKFVEDNKPEYYLALRQSQKTFKTPKDSKLPTGQAENKTIIPWLDFFLTIFLKQSEMAIDLLSKENIERLLTQKQLAVWDYLQKVDSATPREISEKTKVAYPTVRQAINKLMRLKKIERIGQGRSTSYRKL